MDFLKVDDAAQNLDASFSSNLNTGIAGQARSLEEKRLRREMRKKLRTTKIADLVLEDPDGTEHLFSEYYDYIESIGSGGFGYVVKAVDRESGELVALKIVEKSVSESRVTCLRLEAEILKSLDHENIVKFKSYREFANYAILGIEHCQGGSLK